VTTNQLRRVKAEADQLGLQPRRIAREEERPQRADFGKDVAPFVTRSGGAMACILSGSYAAIYGIAYLTGARWATVRIEPLPLLVPHIILGAGIAAAGYGIGALWQLRRQEPQFTERLWRITHEETEFTTKQDRAVFLQSDSGYSKVPDIDEQNRRDFCRAVLNGATPLSEAGAGGYDISRRQWETFRDWGIVQGILQWKDDANHNAGVDFDHGGRAAFETIINQPHPG
jgi:hypothetical protein